MKAWPAQLASGAVVLLLGAVLVFAQPLGEGGELARACAAVVVWGLSAMGLGGGILGRARAGEALALGIGILGLVLLLFAGLGLLSPFMIAGVAVAGAAGWILRPELEVDLDPRVGVLLLPLLAMGGIQALAPPIDTDEIYQHLALPKMMLHTGGLVGGMFTPDGSRPMGLHLNYAALLSFGGAPAVKGFHLLLALLLLAEVQRLGEKLAPMAGWAGAMALAGSFTFLRELGLADNNLPTSLMGLYALRAVIQDRPGRLALFSGLALSFKYTAAPLVFGLYLGDLVWRRDLKRSAWTTAAALGMVAPWWIRNLLGGLHPLFPYAGWPAGDRFVFAYVERYGMGRDLLSMLMLPWNATLHGDPTRYEGFLGRISPLGLAALPGGLYACWRASSERKPAWAVVLGSAAVCLLGWALGAHWLRYLLPAAPAIALAIGLGVAVLPRWGWAAAGLVWVAGLPSNLKPHLQGLAPLAQVLGGERTREALLEEKVPGYAAIRWVNNEAPPTARIAMAFTWGGYHLDRPYVLGSVEDHVPMRHLLYLHGDQTLPLLRELGVTHVVTGRVHFIHKTYPFLDDATFNEQFTQPEEQWEEMLLEQGTLVFEQGRSSVWRL